MKIKNAQLGEEMEARADGKDEADEDGEDGDKEASQTQEIDENYQEIPEMPDIDTPKRVEQVEDQDSAKNSLVKADADAVQIQDEKAIIET